MAEIKPSNATAGLIFRYEVKGWVTAGGLLGLSKAEECFLKGEWRRVTILANINNIAGTG